MNSWDIDPNLYRPVFSSWKEIKTMLINGIEAVVKSVKYLAAGQWRGQYRVYTKPNQADYSCRSHHGNQARVAEQCNYPDPIVF